jgi:hypothetical protein
MVAAAVVPGIKAKTLFQGECAGATLPLNGSLHVALTCQADHPR